MSGSVFFKLFQHEITSFIEEHEGLRTLLRRIFTPMLYSVKASSIKNTIGSAVWA